MSRCLGTLKICVPSVIIEHTSAIVKTNKKFLFQRHIAYLKPIPTTINSIYLHRAILSDNVQRQIDERVKGIAQKTLNLPEIFLHEGIEEGLCLGEFLLQDGFGLVYLLDKVGELGL